MITEDFPIRELFADLIWVECIALPIDNSKLNLELGKKYGFLSKLQGTSTAPSRYVDEAGTQVPVFYFKLIEAPPLKELSPEPEYAPGQREPHAPDRPIQAPDVLRYAQYLLGEVRQDLGDILPVRYGEIQHPDIDLDDLFKEL